MALRRTHVAALGTTAALGGLAALALASGSRPAPVHHASAAAPQVRTEVLRRTVHVGPPGAAAPSLAAGGGYAVAAHASRAPATGGVARSGPGSPAPRSAAASRRRSATRGARPGAPTGRRPPRTRRLRPPRPRAPSRGRALRAGPHRDQRRARARGRRCGSRDHPDQRRGSTGSGGGPVTTQTSGAGSGEGEDHGVEHEDVEDHPAETEHESGD